MINEKIIGSNILDKHLDLMPNIKWLNTSPLCGDPYYPLIIDLVESLHELSSKPIIHSIYSAIAPTFEDLKRIFSKDHADLNFEDITDGDDWNERYLLWALGEVIGSLGKDYGIVIHNPHRYDQMSKKLIKILLHQSKSKGLHIAIYGSMKLIRDLVPKSEISMYNIINFTSISDYKIVHSERAMQFLAISPQGLPAELLHKLINCSNYISSYSCIGPSRKEWLFLPYTTRKMICSNIPLSIKYDLHSKIFDSWNPTGWNYLRRAGHAFASRSTARILSQYRHYLSGMSIGIDFCTCNI